MKKWIWVLSALLLAAVLGACESRSIGVIGGADGPTSVFVADGTDAQIITAEEAEQAALEHAGLAAADVHFHRTELDADDGVLHYDVEFHRGAAEYEYEIRANDGKILSFETEN